MRMLRPQQISNVTHENFSNGNKIPEFDNNQKYFHINYQTTENQSTLITFWKQLVWRNVIALTYLHIAALYGLYLALSGKAYLATYIFGYVYGVFSGFGISAGAHRLWAHRAYKAKWQLRIILAIFQTMAFQNCIYVWVRDHRVHHKFTDTDADPHNIRRGFFFSHMGWLLMKKHPDVTCKGKEVDMTDLEKDPIVMFQKKYYLLLMPIFSFIVPTVLPYYLFNESLTITWYGCAVLRYTITLHSTWIINSIAHTWGSKPYDKYIKPTNNLMVGIVSYGEGWHNYHHVFPWDYKTSELGHYSLNVTTGFIDFFSKIGWAYDMKTVSEEMIIKRAKRTGDGSTAFSDCCKKISGKDVIENAQLENENMIWGWYDKDMTDKDRNEAIIINKTK